MRYLPTSSRFIAIAACVTICSLPAVAAAQTSSAGLFGGTRTVGGATGTTAGQRTNLGSQLGGAGGTIAGATQLDAADTGSITGNERFTREGAAGQFVGADTADLASVLGTAVDTQVQQLRLNNLDQNAQDVNTGGDQATIYRIRYQLGFRAPIIPQASIMQRLGRPFDSSRFLDETSGHSINARIEGSQVVLEGQVATVAEKNLAKRMALLEPGVWQVDDSRLVVTGSADEDPANGTSSANAGTQGQAPRTNQNSAPPTEVPAGLAPTFSRRRFQR